jgi:methylmalonyl-CoA/ethylmalonyl-CoA epimerase
MRVGRTVAVILTTFMATAGPDAQQAPGQTPGGAPQAAPPPITALTGGVLTHLGVATPDINATARKYADLWGVAVPPVTTESIDVAGGGRAELRVATISMPDFAIELNEPVTKSGPVYDHLQKYGLTVHHMGVAIPGSVEDARAELVRKGGRLTATARSGAVAYVDLRQRVGATLEIVRQTAPPSETPTPNNPTGLFGGRRPNHIGLAVANIEETMANFVDIFGVRPAGVNTFPATGAMPFPPGHKWSSTISVRTNMLRYGRINFELIQSVGSPSPWTETYEKQKGLGIQHIAVGRQPIERNEWLKMGQEKGGKWTNGGTDSPFAYLDFTDTTGLIIE